MSVVAPACAIDTVPLPEGEGDGAGDTHTHRYHDPGEAAGGTDEDDWNSYDGAVPQAGGIDPNGFYWSDYDPFIFLAAVAGTFPGPGLVIIRNPDRGDEYRAPSSPSGSMAAVINAELYDTLEVSFEQAGVIIDKVWITLQSASVAACAANADLDENMPPDPTVDYGQFAIGVHRSATGDTVTVYAEAGVLVPGILVVVANPRLGIAERGIVEVDGSFVVIIEAEPGDELLIFAVEPATSNGGGPSMSLIVP